MGQQVMPREEEGVWSTGVLFGITPLSLAWAQVYANTGVASLAQWHGNKLFGNNVGLSCTVHACRLMHGMGWNDT